MSADGVAAPMDAGRSTEIADNSSPLELQLTDPNGHPTQSSKRNYRARPDGQTGIQQQGAQPGLDLLMDSKGGRVTSADAGRCVGTGGLQLASRPGDGSTRSDPTEGRIQQQVERGQIDLLMDATTEPCVRLGASEPEAAGRVDRQPIEAYNRHHGPVTARPGRVQRKVEFNSRSRGARSTC